jgi:competence protein ComEA
MSRADRFYIFITVFLVIAVIVGGVMLVKHGSEPVEIVLSQTTPPQQSGGVYISGAVANPGFYALVGNDTIQDLLLDVAVENDADLDGIKIYIPQEGEQYPPQKIDINRAETWLLEALPGIGETKAQTIVDYRDENGPFGRIEDLLQVEGIGPGIFERIKDCITVSD